VDQKNRNRAKAPSPWENVRSVLLLVGLLCALASQARPAQSSYKQEVKAGVEQIYVFRTTRTQHQSGATPACAAAPFPSANEDYYDLRSIELRGSDSRVVNTHKSSVGGFTACMGQLVKDQPLQMYATGKIANVPWTGIGECLVLKSQPPVRTAIAFTCRLDLSGLPEAYSGGFLVSSTLAPFLGKDQPATAHVPGYLSTSVVTLRLWKEPPAATGSH
jgi:hypothetical protein